VRDAGLWPQVAECLAVPTLRSAATLALEAGGEPVVPVLARLFDRPGTPRAALLRAARVVGRLPGPAAIALPLARLAHSDPEVRHALIEALCQRGFRASDVERPAIETRLREECRHAAALAASLGDIGDDAAAGLLRAALEAEIARCRDMTVVLLSFLSPGAALLDARRNLASDAAQKRAYAVEVVDGLCPSALRALVVPLVEARSGAALLARLQPAPPRLGEAGRLRALCAGDAPWLTPWARACALHMAGSRGLTTLVDVVMARLDDPDPAVRETALWALSRLRPGEAAPQAVGRLLDPAPLVAALARSLLGPLPVRGA
jgi:HEAT repeat protein